MGLFLFFLFFLNGLKDKATLCFFQYIFLLTFSLVCTLCISLSLSPYNYTLQLAKRSCRSDRERQRDLSPFLSQEVSVSVFSLSLSLSRVVFQLVNCLKIELYVAHFAYQVSFEACIVQSIKPLSWKNSLLFPVTCLISATKFSLY